jgi:hypothetical protein
LFVPFFVWTKNLELRGESVRHVGQTFAADEVALVKSVSSQAKIET